MQIYNKFYFLTKSTLNDMKRTIFEIVQLLLNCFKIILILSIKDYITLINIDNNDDTITYSN